MAKPGWLTIAAIGTGCGGHPASKPDASKDAPVVDAGSIDAPGAACSDYNASNNLYWGDLHTHTALSADAYEWGNRNFPHDAYQFASNPEALTQIAAAGLPNPGPEVSIDRALDFDAVTDHSEWLGATWGCGEYANGSAFNPSSPYLTTSQCLTYRAEQNGVLATFIADAEDVVKLECDGAGEGSSACSAFTASAFEVERQAAHDAYQPCTFTPLVAYEYTRAANGATLHQNVIFGSENVPDVPFDSTEYTQPADLWNALDQNCTSAMGCSVLTIPHNSNLSQGSAFVIPAGVGAMQQMNQYQRLVEIHQHKGNSECYAGSNAPDPTCDFEHVGSAETPTPELPANFVRHALGAGITAYAQSAVDPLQMGIVGATDDHNGIPGYVKEDTWQGHVGDLDYTPAQRLAGVSATHNPGGITGVWAPQNTREDIFAALQRRETYATSGPRMAVRFYEVWNTTDYCGAQGGGFPANIIADGGVPMGGTMPAGPGSATAPQFVVNALKDTDDLAEVDIIKGMYVDGALTESVQRFYPSTANTTWTTGSACIGWTDPAFDAGGPAFYYVRVLQVPTWRWSHYDCLADPTAAGCGSGSGSNTLDVMIQERAWTSPIWWLP
jgi:hypothetical protein